LKVSEVLVGMRNVSKCCLFFSEVRVRVLANSEIAKEVAKCRKNREVPKKSGLVFFQSARK